MPSNAACPASFLEVRAGSLGPAEAHACTSGKMIAATIRFNAVSFKVRIASFPSYARFGHRAPTRATNRGDLE